MLPSFYREKMLDADAHHAWMRQRIGLASGHTADAYCSQIPLPKVFDWDYGLSSYSGAVLWCTELLVVHTNGNCGGGGGLSWSPVFCLYAYSCHGIIICGNPLTSFTHWLKRQQHSIASSFILSFDCCGCSTSYLSDYRFQCKPE